MNRDLVFQLNPVAQTVVDVEVRHLIRASLGISVADPTKVDLPMPIARSFGVVGAKWRSTLCVRGNVKEKG